MQDSNDANAQNEETDFDEEIVLLDNTASFSQMSMMVVSYVSGFVVRRITKKIKCDVCVQSSMSTSSEILYNSLIVKKDYSKTNKGYLTYPSDDVITLCCNAERFFRENMKNKIMTYLIFAKCVLKVLRNVQYVTMIIGRNTGSEPVVYMNSDEFRPINVVKNRDATIQLSSCITERIDNNVETSTPAN